MDILYHPDYDKKKHTADIALIRVDKHWNMFEILTTGFEELSASDLVNNLNQYTLGTILWNFSPPFKSQQLKVKEPFNIHNQIMFYHSGSSECPPQPNSR